MSDTSTTAAATTTAATTTTANWFDGQHAAAGFADTDVGKSEFNGYIQNRGYDKLDAKIVAANAIKAHREAEKHIGAPANELVRWPKDVNDTNWNDVRTRLGVPADAKEYSFADVKFADGTALDDNFVNAIAPALKAANVSKDAAPGVVKAIVSFMEQAETTEAQGSEAALNQEREALKINWGSNVDTNLNIAKQTAKTLGVDPAAITALEKQVGYSKVMEMFRNIGVRIGEDKFVQGNGGPGTVMSQDAARAKLSSLQNDSEWVKQFNNGSQAHVQEFHNLTQILAQR